MKAFSFPNVKNIFVPDPGFEIFDIDLDSADLRIVTWESDCKWHKQCFVAKLKPYVELAKEFYRDPTITKHHKSYKTMKALCHATNYLGQPDGVAPRIGMLVHEVDRLQKWYFGHCPEIKKWQEDLIRQIETKRVVSNAWGYRIHAFDRPDAAMYRELVAWIPQSSVGILINHGLINIDATMPEVHVLLQTHDSLSGQSPLENAAYHRQRIIEACTVPIPYADPLIIPVGLKTSSNSWGECG